MTLEQAFIEAQEYFNNYKELKMNKKGIALKVRIVKFEDGQYAWHDYSDDVFSKNSWKDEETVMILQ